MTQYHVPYESIRFAFEQVMEVPAAYTKNNPDMDMEFVSAIWAEAGRFAQEQLAPLNQSGDEGCQWQDGEVTTPTGFKSAYQQFVENGWPALAQPEELGGQGLPMSLQFSIYEMLVSANLAWTLYPTITWGAVTTLKNHGTEEQKADYLPGLVSGQSQGTMCLTEAHCGSDLGLLKTKATPNEDGSYAISGGKIFISSGEHDMVDNVVHITLARIEGAPEGVRGISLFLVPKFLPNEQGEFNQRNTVACGSIEHKMGIHGNATCVINFDGAKGFLIGEPNRGLANMFTFINESRVDVCLQAQGQIEKSFQNALAYAKERLQMKASPRFSTDRAADPIIAHPEIRRLLLTQQAFSEASRMMSYELAEKVDRLHDGGEVAAEAQAVLAFLTPIAKGFITEAAMEATSHGVQILGGHGFISEYGMEQLYRDVRITAIYEGTTAIQGIDLISRKIIADDQRQLNAFIDQVSAACEEAKASDLPDLNQCASALSDVVADWQNLNASCLAKFAENSAEVNAAASDYLMFCGYIVAAYYLLRAANKANAYQGGDYSSEFLEQKQALLSFYVARILPRTQALAAAISAGNDSIADYWLKEPF
ncbi:acyl-CoA dehydrogenase family protein [uncultured Pseudoteredinibacter sp.]|uniref:acyl-CoA dehydrogenase family protein n=1 Tax=uncultured Pseudoteredinibacter sp. TaxID=1641701 RepID=UPI00261BC86F|nr:acyl-CoA dehydrogenase family protein [uncultured Pseudoteredinibacter sp.]